MARFWRLVLVFVFGVVFMGGVFGQVVLPGSPFASVSSGGDTGEVSVKVVGQYERVVPGGRFALAVVLEISPGWHLYANPKQGEFGKDTEILPQENEHVRFGAVQYPAGEKYTDETLDASNQIYKGRVVCYVPVEVGEGALTSLSIDLDLQGQLCSEGTCQLWDDRGSIEIPVAGDFQGGLDVTDAQLFLGFDAAAAWRGISGQEAEAVSGGWVESVSLAVLVGLIMNLMPCVLPLIPIIVLTLIKQCVNPEGQTDRGRSIRVGLAFAAGIMIVFAGLAVLMSVFKLAWGQQFQSTGFKFALLMIVYVLSLSMFGVFEIILPSWLSNMSVVRQGYLGAVGMGALVTILATPCGAPLLGGVLAWSLARPLAVMIVVFLMVGAGMAFPYVLLTAFPRLMDRIPKSGNWMLHLKYALGFGVLAFTVYLILLFPAGWYKPLLYYCVVVGFCVWLGLGTVNRNTALKRRIVVRGIALLLIVGASVLLALTPKAETSSVGKTYWLDELHNYQQQSRTVIVKFTANWCKNCAVLDKIIYKQPVFKDKLKQTNTALIIADWSYDDPAIKAMVQRLAGAAQALPFAAVFPAGREEGAILLRDFYSLEESLRALDKAHEVAQE